MTVHALADETWPGIGARTLVLLPIGSLEQHGPHLPLDTDTAIACAVAEQVATRLGRDAEARVLVAPPLVYGASGEHQSFPGTVSIGREALRMVLVELVRSLSTWSGRTVIINGHVGNTSTLTGAIRQMIAEGHDVSWASCSFGSASDAHAGHEETSVLLHVCPERVDMTRAVVGNTAPIGDLFPELVKSGVAAVSSTGVLGDPTGANALAGAALLDARADRIAADVRMGVRRPDGGLGSVGGGALSTNDGEYDGG